LKFDHYKTNLFTIIIANAHFIMKLTIPEMNAISENGFPIFKPYGDLWYLIAENPDNEEGPHDVVFIGNCTSCYRMCSVHHLCQHDGHPPAIVAPLAVILKEKSTIRNLMPCVYTLHPKMAAAMLCKRGADHVSDHPHMECAPYYTIGHDYSNAILNHLQILPLLSWEGLSDEEEKDEAYRMIMSSFLKAIKSNCFKDIHASCKATEEKKTQQKNSCHVKHTPQKKQVSMASPTLGIW
jgi:hypothetical protein